MEIQQYYEPQFRMTNFLYFHSIWQDRLCGLVDRVSGYRYRGLGLDSRRYQIF